jgi:hypothetical protein
LIRTFQAEKGSGARLVSVAALGRIRPLWARSLRTNVRKKGRYSDPNDEHFDLVEPEPHLVMITRQSCHISPFRTGPDGIGGDLRRYQYKDLDQSPEKWS